MLTITLDEDTAKRDAYHWINMHGFNWIVIKVCPVGDTEKDQQKKAFLKALGILN